MPSVRRLNFLLPAFFLGCLLLLVGQAGAKEGGSKSFDLVRVLTETVNCQPEIHRSKCRVRIGEARILTAQAAFDPSLNLDFTHENEETYIFNGEQGKNQTERVSSFSLNLTKQTRSGVSFGPKFELDRVSFINGKDFIVDDVRFNQAAVKLFINIPLLKDSGRRVVGAAEEASAISLEAERCRLRHTVAGVVRSSCRAYWDYLRADRQLDLRREIRDRAQKILADTRLLVAGNEKPAADLITIEASLAGKEAALTAAEHDYQRAAQTLGLAMGIGNDAIDQLPKPTTVFPVVDDKFLKSMQIDVLRSQAAKGRADLAAVENDGRALEVLLTAARHNRLPRLDLKADIGYNTFKNGDSLSDLSSALTSNIPGTNYSGGLLFSYPLGNSGARSAVLDYEARLEDNRLLEADLKRHIAAAIRVAIDELASRLRELADSNRAIALYREAVANEQLARRRGLASILDVINMEDRLENARLERLARLTALAQALVDLGYQAGALVDDADDSLAIDFNHPLNFYFGTPAAG